MDKKHMVNYLEQMLDPIKSMFNTVVDRELLIKFVKDTYCILADDNVYLYKPQSEFLKDFDKDNNIFDKSNIQNNTNSNNSISVQETCNQYGIVYDKSINLFKNAYNTDNEDIIFKRKHFETFYVIPAIYADEFIIKIFYHSYLMLFKTLNENMEKDKIILQNKDKQNIEQQNKYIPTPAFNNFCYNVLKSTSYEPIAIPLVSLFFSVPRVFREYKDVRLYINSYITNIHHFGHEKVSYNKIYKNNHFFLWLMFRCVISTTYNYTSRDQYFRFKEAALFGISHNKDLSNIKNIFKVCVDIFSILNLKQAQLLGNEKEDDVYMAYSDIKIHSYPYSKIIFSDEMKEYLVKVIQEDNTTEGSTNNNNSIILDSMSLTEIYIFFRDTFQNFYNIEQINYMYIFATNNPNKRNFWKGVRRYNQPINSNKTRLLFIKVSEYIQVRFWDLIYKDNNTKYIIILYTDDYIPNGNYIINCRDMPVNNKIGKNLDKFTFYWYDKINGEIVKLSNKYNIDTKASADAGGGYICTYEKDEKDENNKKSENLGGVYYPEFNRFHIDYKQYTFEFLNYLVKKEQSCIASIQLRAPITGTNVVSTVSDGAMKVDIYITATKDGYTLPYELTNCVCYLYVCDTEEIIEGTISVIRDDKEKIEFLTTFSFTLKRRLTSWSCKLSLSLNDFKNIHQGNSKNCLSIFLNYKAIDLKYYKQSRGWNIEYLPVVYKIKQACFMRGYDFSDENNQKIQLKVNIDKKGKDVSNVEVESYIIWFGGEKNIDNDGDPSNIKILKGKDNNLLIGDEIEYILPKEWTREELYNNPNKYIVFFPYIIQHDKLQKLKNDNTKLPTFTSEDYKYHTAFKTSCNKLSAEAVKLINDDKNMDKIELQAIYNYPFDKKISETKWHIMVHDATSPIYVDGKPIVGHNYEMVFNNLDRVSAYNIEFDKNKFNVNMIYLLAEKGEKITFPYDSMFLDKKLIFFASMSTLELSSSVSYMFTQPITLIFDGETLQIYENGLKLDGYGARSGKVEKRKAIPAKSVNTEDNQTLNTVANKEDNITQAEEKNNLNLIDDEDSIKKVAYPGVSASATLAQDYNGKYYYYDDKNTTKIPEGEYYILFDEPSKSSSTDNADTQSNEIIVGEPSKFQDKLGERYIEIYKSSELLFNNEDSFNQSINKRKAETKENFSWFGNKTSYLIHGGKNYEDENGINLSSSVTTFCKNLATLVSDTFKDKLYKVYGKVPIKLEVEYSKILRLEVIRKWGKYGASNIPTISEFKLSKNHKCILNGHILEREGPDTLESGKLKRIPEGTYNARWWTSSISFSYTNSDYIIKNEALATENKSRSNILPNLYNDYVKKERYILIHNGNYIEHSKGCLLLGTDKCKQRNNVYYDMVTDSNKILKNFIEELIKHDPTSYKNYSTNPTIKNFIIIIKNKFIE